MNESIEDVKKELSLYKANGLIGYYYQLNKWVNEAVALMRATSPKSILVPDESDAKKFERMMTLIKTAKDWIDTMEEIKVKINITGNEAKDTQTPIFRITPENMADNIGELAGKKS